MNVNLQPHAGCYEVYINGTNMCIGLLMETPTADRKSSLWEAYTVDGEYLRTYTMQRAATHRLIRDYKEWRAAA